MNVQNKKFLLLNPLAVSPARCILVHSQQQNISAGLKVIFLC